MTMTDTPTPQDVTPENATAVAEAPAAEAVAEAPAAAEAVAEAPAAAEPAAPKIVSLSARRVVAAATVKAKANDVVAGGFEANASRLEKKAARILTRAAKNTNTAAGFRAKEAAQNDIATQARAADAQLQADLAEATAIHKAQLQVLADAHKEAAGAASAKVDEAATAAEQAKAALAAAQQAVKDAQAAKGTLASDQAKAVNQATGAHGSTVAARKAALKAEVRNLGSPAAAPAEAAAPQAPTQGGLGE